MQQVDKVISQTSLIVKLFIKININCKLWNNSQLRFMPKMAVLQIAMRRNKCSRERYDHRLDLYILDSNQSKHNACLLVRRCEPNHTTQGSMNV